MEFYFLKLLYYLFCIGIAFNFISRFLVEKEVI